MSKLLRRAKVKLQNVENNYGNIGVDDAFLDDCCYNLQQSIEFTLKYLVEISGLNCVTNHDIRASIKRLKKANVHIPYEQELSNMATIINDWETSSRYKDDFVGLIDDLDKALIYAKELIIFADSKIEDIGELNSAQTFPDEKLNATSDKLKNMNLDIKTKK